MSVQEFMMKSGVPIHLKGYAYIQEAIEYCIKEPDSKIGVVEMELAKAHNTTTACIERDIRTALNKGYPYMDEDIKQKLFRGKSKATTALFVKTISNAIRYKMI